MTDLPKIRATSVPTATHTDHTRKRRMSEGPRRRRFGAVSAEDIDLDADNARIWREVYTSRLLCMGETVESVRGVGIRTSRGLRISKARGAAFWICYHEYGIPTSRLGDLAGISRQCVGRWVKREDLDTARDRPQTAFIEVTQEAADALARAAEKSGESPVVLASAAVIAFGASS